MKKDAPKTQLNAKQKVTKQIETLKIRNKYLNTLYVRDQAEIRRLKKWEKPKDIIIFILLIVILWLIVGGCSVTTIDYVTVENCTVEVEAELGE